MTISNPAGPVPGRILELKYGRNWSQICGELFRIQNNTTESSTDETNGVSNAVRCNKDAVQFSASFVTSLFASFDEICRMATIFFNWVTLNKKM